MPGCVPDVGLRRTAGPSFCALVTRPPRSRRHSSRDRQLCGGTAAEKWAACANLRTIARGAVTAPRARMGTVRRHQMGVEAWLLTAGVEPRLRYHETKSSHTEEAMTKRYTRRSLLIGGAAAGAATTLGLPQVRAQAAWPNRPVTIICPWGAGGGTDATARIVARCSRRSSSSPSTSSTAPAAPAWSATRRSPPPRLMATRSASSPLKSP